MKDCVGALPVWMQAAATPLLLCLLWEASAESEYFRERPRVENLEIDCGLSEWLYHFRIPTDLSTSFIGPWICASLP